MIVTILLILLVIGTFFLFRHLRKREIEAFMGADISMFEDPAGSAGGVKFSEVEAVVDPAIPSMHLKLDADKVEGAVYELKPKLLDEIHEVFLTTLSQVVDDYYHILFRFPLSELVKTDDPLAASQLAQHQVTCLLCEKDSFDPVCGIQLKGVSLSETESFTLIQNIFSQIDRPLFSLPLTTGVTRLEIEEILGLLPGYREDARKCPKCGKKMSLRLATKGKSTGKTFWVCKDFPHCKGVARFSPLH